MGTEMKPSLPVDHLKSGRSYFVTVALGGNGDTARWVIDFDRLCLLKGTLYLQDSDGGLHPVPKVVHISEALEGANDE